MNLPYYNLNKAMKISTTLDMYCVDDGDKERYVSSATNNANTWIDEKIEDKDNPAECKCD